MWFFPLVSLPGIGTVSSPVLSWPLESSGASFFQPTLVPLLRPASLALWTTLALSTPSLHGTHIQQSHKHSVPPLPSLKFPGTLTIFPEAAQVGGEEKAKSSSEAVSKGLTLLSISKGFPPLDSTNKYLMYLVYTEFYILKADTTISALWNP